MIAMGFIGREGGGVGRVCNDGMVVFGHVGGGFARVS